MIDPKEVILRDLQEPVIRPDTEAALLAIPLEQWQPIILQGKRCVDGMQRVLVARKHGFKLIPCKRLK